MPDLNQSPGVRFLLIAASVVVVIAGLKAAASILLPFALGLFLAVLNLPLLSVLQRNRVPKVLAILIAVLTNALVLGFLGLVASQSVREFVDAFPRYQLRFMTMAIPVLDWLEARGFEAEEIILPDLYDRVEPLVTRMFAGIAAVVTTTFLVLLFMIFVLAEATAFPAKLRNAIGRPDADLSRFTRVMREVQRYLGIKTLVSMTTGALVGIWVWLLGVDFPLLWAMIAFLFNYIPNIGSVLAALPAALMALVQFGPSRALIVALGYLVVNIVLGNLVEPHLMGRKLGLSTLVILLSLLFWNFVWGPVGMLLAVPLTMIVKIMLEHTREFDWLAILLGGTAPERFER